MLKQDKIALDIELARERLHQLALRKDFDFRDPEVIRLSQEVDAYIVQYEQHVKRKKNVEDEEADDA